MPATYSTNYQMNTDCPGDGLCSYTLKCYLCDTTNYVLEDGYCISKNQCRKYSRYNSTSLSFNPGFCVCSDAYYLTGVTSCSRCNIECLSCGGATNSDCLTCPEGGSLSSGSCSYNVTYN